MAVSITREDGAATVWDDQFEIDCPKCKSTIFKNTADEEQSTNCSRFNCPNCSGEVELVEQYFLVSPNQSAWPGLEKGDCFAAALRCENGCGWRINLNNQDQMLLHDACGAKIGTKFINGLSEWELEESLGKKLLSLFGK